MSRLCTLASGSTGNSTYISGADGDILIDAGISCKAIIEGVAASGCDIFNLKAVAVTHDHTDHIKGLKAFLKKVKVPIIASSQTLASLIKADMIPAGVKTIAGDQGNVDLGGMIVTYFKTSHDAVGSGGYTVELSDGRRTAVCTDLGIMTDDIRQKLLGCSAVLLESNHDIEMLKRGPYPAELKLRILSDKGHLSNGAAAAELPTLLKGGTARIILGHLSMQNNTQLLAYSAAKAALTAVGAKAGEDYILEIAKPKSVGVTVF